jgi:anti-sigma B factor antagonist
MELINIRTIDGVTVVDLIGELDATSSPLVQQQILPLAERGVRLLLEMTAVTFMSSAGLRMLLSTYRRVSEGGGRIVLVGLSPELRETMAVTGFLGFFITNDSLESGLQALS